MYKKILKTREEWMQNPKKISDTVLKSSEILKMCHCCYAFKYAGEWHFEEAAFIKERDSEEEITVQFTKCPSCIEELLAQYDTEFA